MSKTQKITVKKGKTKSQGGLLRELSEWFGGSLESFADKIGYSRKWISMAIKDERLPMKNQIKICRAFNIPTAYFEGEFVLPSQGPALLEYKPESDSEVTMLREENIQLRKKLNERDALIIELQQELIKFFKARETTA